MGGGPVGGSVGGSVVGSVVGGPVVGSVTGGESVINSAVIFGRQRGTTPAKPGIAPEQTSKVRLNCDGLPTHEVDPVKVSIVARASSHRHRNEYAPDGKQAFWTKNSTPAEEKKK